MMIDRRAFVGTLAAGAVRGAAPARRPNILYIMTDDQAFGEMSCEGNKILRTPNMDRLAAEGVRFGNCFVTNSLCAPSRATALTGCFSHIHGVKGNSEAKDAPPEFIKAGVPTYPELLQKAGYRTGVVGKWHLSDKTKGFDYSCVLPGQGVYFDPDFIENGEKRKIKGYSTDITTDLAMRFLDTVHDQPFLLVYQHKAPHRPFTPAPRHAHMFDDIELPYPPAFDDDYATRRMAREARDMQLDISLAPDYKDEMPKNLDAAARKKWIYQRFVKDHYRATYGVDENLGRMLDYLQRRGFAEDTLIMYTSDNGYFMGEHGWYDKRFMYEPSLRVPLIIRYPRLQTRGRVDSHFVQNIDFAPTILDFAGVEAPHTMQGRSLRPLLEGHPPRDWRQSVYYAYFENSWGLAGKGREALSDPSFAFFTAHRVSPHRGVRTARHKLIEYYSEGDYWELFDLEKDPHELRNVYGDQAYAAVTRDLKAELLRLRREYHDL